MDTRQKNDAEGLAKALAKYGGTEALPILDGPRIDQFNANALALALQSEVARAKVVGWSKVSLHMDLEDALALAEILKRR